MRSSVVGRRGANEGSIFRRSRDGKWVAVVNLGYVSGKRRRKTFVGKTRAEVQRELNRALRDRERGLPVQTERQTVADYLDAWLRDSVWPSKRLRTHERYEQAVRLHIAPEIGRIELSKLTPQHVQRFVANRLAAGRSPSSVRYARTVLSIALEQARKWELVSRNVASLVDPPEVVQRRVPVVTVERARQILHAVAGDRFAALYRVALLTGLRRGELVGLRWGDVDLDEAALTVRRSVQRVAGTVQVVEPKTSRSHRTIALPDSAVSTLKRQRVHQIEVGLGVGRPWSSADFVFGKADGEPLEPSSVTVRFQRLLAEAGLPRMRFHDLRHATASLLIADHVPARVVMEMLGHSSITTTMNIYAHVMPALQREAANHLDDILGLQAQAADTRGRD
jgi:integrase